VGEFRPWAEAWTEALYGPAGFYRRPEGPAGHFRTAAHASAGGLLGAALARLARRAGCAAVLDVGAGRGELLSAVQAADPDLRCTGVDVADRPRGLPAAIGWSGEPAADGPTLLVGWELLDVVPVPVLQLDDAGQPRVVQVRPDGAERLGVGANEADLDWCQRWWPLDGARPGDRIEVGRPRDETWAGLVDALTGAGGLALAVDYGHEMGTRPRLGTLTGYRGGRLVDPLPDGSTDVTAHVALDSVAAVRPGGRRLLQRDALRNLGLDPRRPVPDRAANDPAGYLSALSQTSEAAELLDPAGLGGFGWVLHPVAGGSPPALSCL
jgi:SAM-dependent MidA family methyltransferase